MDLVGGDGRRLVWVGEPDVETGNVQRAIRIGNRLAMEEAASRPWVTFVDVAAMLSGPDGGYSAYLTLPDGSTTRCYAGDGVHLTTSCLDRVMDDLVPTLTGLYEAAHATPGSTTTGPAPDEPASGEPASAEPATQD